MLLPQSSAFAALKNRLNSVSAIGYLHIAPRAWVSRSVNNPTRTELMICRPPATPTASFDRPNRLKPREDNAIRWGELLEKFKSVQEKGKRIHRLHDQPDEMTPTPSSTTESIKDKALPEVPRPPIRPMSVEGVTPRIPPGHKQKSSLGNFSRLTGRVGSARPKK